MTTVKDVLIYEALERNKQYKEEKKKELSDRKVQVKIEKWKVLNRERTEKLIKKQKSRIASWVKTSNLTKKVKKGILIGWRNKKTKTRSQLVKELDTIFSRYIRLSNVDYNWLCKCITCWAKVHWKNIQNWHFITRGNYKYRRREDNCFPQCMPCNIYKSGNYISYTLFMIWRYWQEFVKNMQEDKELVKISTVQIREMIEHYTNAVNIILEQIELYQNRQFI